MKSNIVKRKNFSFEFTEDTSKLIILVENYRKIRSRLLSGTVYTGVEVHRMDLWNDLGFSLCAVSSICHVVTTSDEREKVQVGVSTDWCVTVEHQRLSSTRVISVDYQTSKLQYNY